MTAEEDSTLFDYARRRREQGSAHARDSDPGTSHQAAAHVTKTTLKPSQRDVLEVLQAGPRTQYSLERGRLQSLYSPSRIRTAVAELTGLNKVRDTGEKKRLPSGRNAIIWEVIR